MKHLGIYVHVPFCVKKCRYCDFASWAGRENDMQRYVQAVADEMRRKADALGHPIADTVFFGGGTPTLLPAALLKQLCDAVKDSFPLAENTEWTSEMNPGTITAEKAAALFEGGVNRVSMGVQSASERLLKSIGRIHTAQDAVKAAEIVSTAGIKRLNADMMLALPGMTMRDAEDTARFVLGLGVKHISCYALIPQEGTPLYDDWTHGRLTLPSDEEDREQYELCRGIFRENGILQYEISNFAVPGEECRHNVNCWKREDYLGFGCAAASLWNNDRHTNPRSIDAYLRGDAGEDEQIGTDEMLFEAVMLGLRLTQGIELNEFRQRYGIDLMNLYGTALTPAIDDGRVLLTPTHLFLSERGMDLMNTVLEPLLE